MTGTCGNEIYGKRYNVRRKHPVSVKKVAAIAVKKACSTAYSHINDVYVVVAGLALGLFVFFGCGIFAAAERGYNGGIGGEVILAGAVAFGTGFVWSKIKKHLQK